MNISKELLGKILCCTNINYDFIVDNPRIAEYDKTTLVYTKAIDKQRGEDRYISIYELAYKCKELAEHNGWFLYPCRNFESTFKKFGCSIMKPYYKAGKFSLLSSADGYDERDYLADTEIQAVFNSCQWILDNKDKLNG